MASALLANVERGLRAKLPALNYMRFSGWVCFAKTPDIGIERHGQSRIVGASSSRHLAT
jgi:hypothetical protein